MLPFFSFRYHRREPVIGRALVTAVALLFLVTALLCALPSPDGILAFLEQTALSGYESVAETTPARQPILEEFYDRPQESAPASTVTPSTLQPETAAPIKEPSDIAQAEL